MILSNYFYLIIVIWFMVSRESPCSLVDNVQDCDIIVSEFKFQLRCYVHLWTNTLRKDTNLSAIDWVVPLLFFYNAVFGIK